MYLSKTKGLTFRIISAALTFFFMSSFILPKDVLAYRSRDGGGEISEFTFTDFASTVGISLGTFIAGQAIGGALSSGWNALTTGTETITNTANQLGSAVDTLQSLTSAAGSAPLSPDAIYACQTVTQSIINNGSQLTSSFGGNASNVIGIANSLNGLISPGVTGASLAPLVADLGSSAAQISSIASGATVAGSVFSGMSNGFVNSFSSLERFGTKMLQGYSTFVAASQATRAVGMIGAYQGWNPRQTFVVSGVTSGIIAGLLNPAEILGKPSIYSGTPYTPLNPPIDPYTFTAMAKGAFVGGFGQFASSLAIVAIDGDKLAKGEGVGALAQLAGLTAGLAGTNFGRELMNPSPLLTDIIQWKETKTDDGQTKITYIDKVTDTEIKEDVNERAGGNKVPVLDNASKLIKLYDPEPGINPYGLYKATVVNTLEEYPRLLARGAGFLLSDALVGRSKNYVDQTERALGSLISGVTEEIARPILQSVADIGGIRPSLYLANNIDSINANLAYKDAKINMAFNLRKEKDIAGLTERIKSVEKMEGLDEETKIAKLKEVISQYFKDTYGPDEKGKYKEFIPMTKEDILNKLKVSPEAVYQEMLKRTASNVGAEGSSLEAENPLHQQLVAMNTKSASDIKNSIDTMDGAQLIKNQAITQINAILAAELDSLKKNGDITYDNALAKLRLSTTDVVSAQFSKMGSSMLFGIFESGIRGGIHFGFNQLFFNEHKNDYDNYAQAMLGASIANMGSALARGIAWNIGWEPNGEWWSSKVSYTNLAQQEPKYSDKLGGKDSVLAAKLYESAQVNYAFQKKAYENFLEYSGAKAGMDTRAVFNYKINDYISESFPAAHIKFSEQQPSLAEALGTSISQATTESFIKSFSFGLPLVNSEQVSSFSALSYLNSLRSLSPQKNFFNTIGSSVIESNLSVIQNNVFDVLAANKEAAKFLNIAPERLVKTNSAVMPFTLQYLQYNPDTNLKLTEFYAPFPNPIYGPRPYNLKDSADYLRRLDRKR